MTSGSKSSTSSPCFIWLSSARLSASAFALLTTPGRVLVLVLVTYDPMKSMNSLVICLFLCSSVIGLRFGAASCDAWFVVAAVEGRPKLALSSASFCYSFRSLMIRSRSFRENSCSLFLRFYWNLKRRMIWLRSSLQLRAIIMLKFLVESKSLFASSWYVLSF